MGEWVLAGFEIDPLSPGLLNAGLLNACAEGCAVDAIRSMGDSVGVNTVGIEVTQSFVQIGFSLQ